MRKHLLLLTLGIALLFVALLASPAWAGPPVGGVLVTEAVPNADTTSPIQWETVSLDGYESTAALDTSLVSYEWDFGDGSTGVGITVDHSYGEVGQYTVTLTVTDSAGTPDTTGLIVYVRPLNDAFADAVTLSPTSSKQFENGATYLATSETGEAEANWIEAPLNSVWYKFVAPITGTAWFYTSWADYDTFLAAYTGSAVDGLTTITWNDDTPLDTTSAMAFPVTEGDTYYVQVDGAGGNTGYFELSYMVVTTPPANDDFEDAVALNPGDGAVTSIVYANDLGYTFGSTKQTGEPGTDPVDSVWYQWTSTTPGELDATLDGDFNTLAFYTGDAVDDLTPVADDEGHIRTTAGTTYYLQVKGVLGYEGDLDLFHEFTPLPANDHFTAAQVLGASGSLDAYNYLTGGDPDEPSASGQLNTMWYRWTAPVTGPATVGMTCADFDTFLAVYDGGPAITQLHLIGSDGGASVPAHKARVDFDATAGTTYWFQVDGWDDLEGEFGMSWECLSPPVFLGGTFLEFLAYQADEITVAAAGELPMTFVGDGELPQFVTWVDNGDGTVTFTADGPSSLGDYSFTLHATNASGNAERTYTIRVSRAPEFHQQPESQTVNEGDLAYFSARFDDNSYAVWPAATRQWQVSTDGGDNWTDIAGETGSVLEFAVAKADDGKQYRQVADNGVGDPVASDAATLTVQYLSIKTQPLDVATVTSGDAQFKVEADRSLTPDVSYQWEVSSSNGRKWVPLTGQTSATLDLTKVTSTMNGYLYHCKVTTYKTVTSRNAKLTVTSTQLTYADVKITQPQNLIEYDSATKVITWWIYVENLSDNGASGLVFKTTLASGTKFVSVTSGHFDIPAPKVGSRSVTFRLASLGGHASGYILLKAVITRAVVPIPNTVYLTTTGTFDPDPTNNTSTTSLDSL